MGGKVGNVIDLVVRCAWCERVRVKGGWSPEPVAPTEVRRIGVRSYLTHGICPACFRSLAPDVAYPVE